MVVEKQAPACFSSVETPGKLRATPMCQTIAFCYGGSPRRPFKSRDYLDILKSPKTWPADSGHACESFASAMSQSLIVTKLRPTYVWLRPPFWIKFELVRLVMRINLLRKLLHVWPLENKCSTLYGKTLICRRRSGRGSLGRPFQSGDNLDILESAKTWPAD